MALSSAGFQVYAAKDERAVDFVLDTGLRLEVGGACKKRKAADRVVRDDVELSADEVIAIWTLGFLR
ncbi:MAG: hypothetical protein ACPGUV_04695 [Polyangiales bacterium]